MALPLLDGAQAHDPDGHVVGIPALLRTASPRASHLGCRLTGRHIHSVVPQAGLPAGTADAETGSDLSRVRCLASAPGNTPINTQDRIHLSLMTRLARGRRTGAHTEERTSCGPVVHQRNHSPNGRLPYPSSEHRRCRFNCCCQRTSRNFESPRKIPPQTGKFSVGLVANQTLTHGHHATTCVTTIKRTIPAACSD
jgi:hypothetical protein